MLTPLIIVKKKNTCLDLQDFVYAQAQQYLENDIIDYIFDEGFAKVHDTICSEIEVRIQDQLEIECGYWENWEV